ncbi:winged helix-turn-helix domain-containing protein [Serratia marcescens]|nr:winged helix-turn-helix domain-containing protein [Serratia marcescens]ELQ9440542.1 winged helix-turn-helix domain-containing protein [Serratia marcescens]ELT5561982.1 winged helix-turn-helix domain-containing protein [Serratia marcescens]MBH2585566.1 winged helix-turn-helix domain-containing protein [Serratia marcescens]MBH2729073.1 winged helix-turn-helix domain-containing protein [Serratia marcescens]
MIFNINDNVLYNEEEGTLAQIDNANGKIALLKPTCRLLSLFIRHNNVLLLRERLLNEVWVEHGLKASNNNLNNYVSGLRKSLAQFGEEELIVTYPRQGFKFTARTIHEINIKEEPDERENEIAKQEITDQARRSNVWRPLQRLVMMIAACLVPFAAIVLYQNSNRINVYPLGSYQQCQIYSMHLGSGNLDKIKRMIQRSGLSCQSRADVYYYGSVRNERTLYDEEQLTYCPREMNSPCINNYINNNQE